MNKEKKATADIIKANAFALIMMAICQTIVKFKGTDPRLIQVAAIRALIEALADNVQIYWQEAPPKDRGTAYVQVSSAVLDALGKRDKGLDVKIVVEQEADDDEENTLH